MTRKKRKLLHDIFVFGLLLGFLSIKEKELKDLVWLLVGFGVSRWVTKI